MKKPTKEQFDEYVALTDKGISNIFDGVELCKQSKTGLTTDICLCIIKHFSELNKEFQAGG